MLDDILRVSQDGQRVYLSAGNTQHTSDQPIEKKQIKDWLVHHQADAFFCFDDTIESALTKLNTSAPFSHTT